ncbi:MAG: Dabb family protein [Chitinophagaceae bacterium]|nr:Dabb family protein [Chitinophagaceae bacterium]
MSRSSRRRFISTAGKVTAATAIGSVAATAAFAAAPAAGFIHHVYFWLKNPESTEDKAKLVEGLRKLAAVKSIRQSHIGQPADTKRDVIDSSYAVSWLLFFKSKEEEESYQNDPIHVNFVQSCSPLWSKVVVYDSVTI